VEQPRKDQGSFHVKAKQITEDFARKVGKWVVGAKRMGASIIKAGEFEEPHQKRG
jgi:hypothetical protein